MSLRARILLLVLLATLAPALVVGVYLTKQRDREVDQSRRSLSALAKYAAAELDNKVRGSVQLLHGLSRAPDLDTRDVRACSRFLTEVLAHYPQYTGLLTITPKGDLHCDSLQTGRVLNVSGREYFKQATATRRPAFDAVFGGLTGIAVLQVAYPVLDVSGNLKYVLLASLNLSQFTRDFVKSGQHRDLTMLVWSGNGTVMVSEPDAGTTRLAGKVLADAGLFHFAYAGEPGATVDLPGPEGRDSIWGLGVPAQPQGLRINLGVPRDLLLAEANRGFYESLAILLGVSLLAFLSAFAVAEVGIRRQVARIMRVMASARAGDGAARIGAPYPRGELGELMQAVDGTVAALQAQRDEIELKGRDLRALNEGLEARVAQRTAALTAANQELETFAYSVSHDLRAPLRAIDGFSQLLLDDYLDKLDPEGRESLRRIRAAAQRVGQLIDEMLKLSGLTRGDMQKRPVDLSAIAERAIEELRAADPRREVAVSIAPGVRAEADPRLITAAMENLLSNAWKFTGKTAAARIEFGAERRAGELVCYVRDNGAGFDMAFAQNLFVPFQRLHRVSEFPGNGVGLATVKQSVSRHGGRVWAEAAPGRGATFYFALPAAEAPGGKNA